MQWINFVKMQNLEGLVFLLCFVQSVGKVLGQQSSINLGFLQTSAFQLHAGFTTIGVTGFRSREYVSALVRVVWLGV